MAFTKDKTTNNNNEDIKLANVVQQTTDYKKFDLISANRDVNRAYIERIKKSLIEDGNFTQAQPLLVNEHYQVIDGQHRLIACTELKLPVYYTVVKGLGIKEARKMNLLHRQWNSLDFLKTYVTQGLKPYLEFQKLTEDYPDFSFSIILAGVKGGHRQNMQRDFRKGEMAMFNLAEVRKRLDNLSELAAINPAFNTRSMAYAYFGALKNVEGFSQKQMVEKVAEKGSSFSAYQGMIDNLRQLETIYNYNRGISNRKRFF